MKRIALNSDNTNLLTFLLNSAKIKNDYVPEEWIQWMIQNFKTTKEAIQFTAEELAIIEPTVQRIAIEREIFSYFKDFRNSYQLKMKIYQSDLPSWLLENWTSEVVLTEFFWAFELADEKVVLSAQEESWKDLASARTLYTEWQDFKWKEQLDWIAKKKVAVALDLRDWMSHFLRYLGYTMSEVDVVLG